jgi:hypothetical protein
MILGKRSFKVGDIVECTDGHFDYCKGPVLGKRYKIISVGGNGSLWKSVGVKVPECTYDLKIRNGTEPNWGEACFKLVKACGPKTETDYLDAFKNNFNEGI